MKNACCSTIFCFLSGFGLGLVFFSTELHRIGAGFFGTGAPRAQVCSHYVHRVTWARPRVFYERAKREGSGFSGNFLEWILEFKRT